MDGRRDLVEPEGVNAGSGTTEPRDAADVQSGGQPEQAPDQGQPDQPDGPDQPEAELAGAPGQSDQALDQQFGVQAEGS